MPNIMETQCSYRGRDCPRSSRGIITALIAVVACNTWYLSYRSTRAERSGARDRRQGGDPRDGGAAFNFTIGICAIVKDMEPYLTEWLDYHLGVLRIDNVYLYDHSPQFYLRSWYANTRDHPLYRRVRVVHWTHALAPQGEAYKDCVVRFGREAAITNYTRVDVQGGRLVREEIARAPETARRGNDYLALMDGDEFLVPRGRHASVHGVLREYLAPYGGALVVNWLLFGSANKTLYSPVPVTKRFQYCDAVPHAVVKTIVKASDFKEVRSPHSVLVREGARVRTTAAPGALQHEQFAPGAGASSADLAATALLLHHYRYLSRKEYDDKNCVRGHVDNKDLCNKQRGRTYTAEELRDRNRPDHLASRPGTVFDDAAWRLLRERVPKYGVFDDERAWGDRTQTHNSEPWR